MNINFKKLEKTHSFWETPYQLANKNIALVDEAFRKHCGMGLADVTTYDLGVGTGAYLKAMYENDIDTDKYVGYEISEELLDYLEEEYPDNKFTNEDAFDSLPYKFFDDGSAVIGNPPYNSPKEIPDYIEFDPYRLQPGSDTQKVKIRNGFNPNKPFLAWLRTAQKLADHSANNITSLILPSSIAESAGYAGVRYSLGRTYQHIYVLDLGGNRHFKFEPDDQIFRQVMTSLSLYIMVKTPAVKETFMIFEQAVTMPAKEHPKPKVNFLTHVAPLSEKLRWIDEDLELNDFDPVEFRKPECRFNLVSDSQDYDKYYSGFCINELFMQTGSALSTGDVGYVLRKTPEEALEQAIKFVNYATYEDFKTENPDSGIKRGVFAKKQDSLRNLESLTLENVYPITKSPFNKYFLVYSPIEGGYIDRPKVKISQNLLENQTCLAYLKTAKDKRFVSPLMINGLSVCTVLGDTSTTLAPLWLVDPDDSDNFILNINPEIVSKFEGYYNHPLEIIYFAYGVLYNPAYQIRYNGYLTYDYPFIPYPQYKGIFQAYSNIGRQLSLIHTSYETNPDDSLRIVGLGTERDKRLKFYQGKAHFSVDSYIEIGQEYWNCYIGHASPLRKLFFRQPAIDIDRLSRAYTAIRETVDLQHSLRILPSL